MKYISSGRIIDVNSKISENAYNNIVELLCEISNPSFFQRKVLLDSEKERLSYELENMQEKYKMLEEKCKLLEEKNNFLENMAK